MKHLRPIIEKKPKGAPDWHDSDAPDANGRFKDLSIKDLAAWLIKTRKKDVKKISGSLTQQIVFNRNDDPKYAEKMEKTRKEVYKQLGREDLLESTLNEGYQYFDGEMARDLKGDSGVKFKKGDKVTLEIQPNNYVIYGPNKTKIIVNKRDFRGAIDQYVIYESLVIEKREDVGKYNTVKKVIKELGRRPSEQELATFINNNYYDVTEVERGDDDPTANDKIADLVGFYKFDIDDWEIAWFDAQNESMVTEGKIKYSKGKTYQSEGHWTVMVDSNSSMCDIRVNHSAGWRLDPHDDREETWELLDNGRQRATINFRRGNIDKFAQQMFDLNDRTTWGNKTKLTAKDYADIIRVWIDMRKANESIVNEASKDKMIRQIERALKDGLSIFKLPMATQKYYNKNKGDFEVVAEKGYNMEDIYDLIAFHRFNTDFRKLSSKNKEWVENDAAERGFNESLLESDIVDKYYSLIDELYEAKPGPDAYMTGLSDKEKEEKEAKMKKQAEMDDDDPDSYEELPGDEEARESGKVKKSKHTTSYNKKFKSESMKNLKSFDNFVTEKRSDLWSPFQKADILAGDMFGAMGLYRLEDDELDQIIDLKKADKLAKKMFGEFGFKTLAAKEMEDLLDNNPKLLRESQVTEFYFENDEEERLQKFVDQLSFGDELEYRDGFSTGRGSFPNTRELKKELDSNFQLLLTQKSGRNWDLYVGSDDLVFIIQPDLGAKNYMQISISSTKEQWNDESWVFARSNGYSVYESVVTEAKAYKLKASEFGANTHSAAYNVKGETTWRVHSTYAIDQVSGENNPEERDVVFFEAMPINNDLYIKIGGINNLKRTNGATVGNNFGTTVEEWKKDPKGIAKEASEFLTDATHLKWINKKARSEGQVIKWALKDDYSSVIEDLVNKALGLSESVDEARSSKEKFEEESGYFQEMINDPKKRVYDIVDFAQFTTGGMTEKQWEMFMYGRYKKHLQSRDAKIKEKMYDVLTKWLTESVNEEKIKYVKGKTYQSSGHWTVVVDSNSSGLDIRVNHSAGWRLDPHDEKEETFELLDNGRQRATLYFKSGNIDKFAKQMFDLNDRTTHGNATKLTAKDYADIIRVWIDMRMANESVVVKRKLVKTLNEYFSGYEYDKFIKEFGKIKYPKYIGVKMKELVAGGFLDKVYNKEANYMAFWLNQMGKRKFDTDARKKELGEVGYKLTDRYWHDLTGSTAFTLLAAEAACEVSKHVEDLIANKEAVEPAYYLMKEYFNNHDMETNRSRIFTMAVEKLEKWMTENSIETL